MPLFPQGFALVDGTKRPAVMWSKPETCKPTASFAGARHGLPTGPRNGVWVVDLDRKGGSSASAVDGLRSLVMHAADYPDEPIPDTYTVRTPSGGLHLYFAWDAAAEAAKIGNPVGILPGVDVRGAGGYVCAGGDYVVALDVPIAVAPSWLVALATSRQATQGATAEVATAIGPDHPEWAARTALAEKFIAGEPPCISGQGGQKQLWKMALRLMRTYELPVDHVRSLLAAYNATCVPPWTDSELTRTLVRAAEEGQGPTGMSVSGLFAPAATVPRPAEDGPWKQVRNPDHVYTFDSSIASPPGKKIKLDMDELANQLVGRGATPEWCGVWQYDSFRRRLIAVNPPMALDAETIGLSDRDIGSLKLWINRRGGSATKENIIDAVNEAGKLAQFHPVRDYLDALPVTSEADARAYFDGIAGRLWGADERNELESGHLMRFAIAAVRRIKVPGTKVDTLLVLAGEQGLRKSLFCERLFSKDFFLDQVPPINSGRGQEASIAIEGRWGVEIAEMSAFIGVHESAKKEFISRCVDKYRPVFGIAVQERPRECVFIVTTNDDDILSDPTGDTRYDVCDVREPIRLEEVDRDVFWSAAVALESAGVPHWRDRAALAKEGRGGGSREHGGFFAGAVMGESAGFVHEDPWADAVLKWATAESAAGGAVTVARALEQGLAMPLERRDDKALRRVRGILRRAFGASRVEWLEGRAQRVYYPGGRY